MSTVVPATDPTSQDHALLQSLVSAIRSRAARVGVVGLGYVGLPFAVEKAKVGFSVTGIERNPKRVESVNRGVSYIGDVRTEDLKPLVEQGMIRAVSDYDSVPDLDVIVIAVPTPLTQNLTPELKYVTHVTQQVAKHLRPGHLVSLESTTFPGTTDEVMRPILEESGLIADQDFFLAHSPERVDPGNQRYTTKNTNKVVGGVGPRSLQAAYAFYSETIEHVVPVSSARAAELVKVFENTYRAVNIALVNELALLCDRMGLNVWEVLEAAFTKPFGIQPFFPGPGVGGHCIPLDPHYLEWKAREYGFNTRFIGLAGEINRAMPEFVAQKAARILNDRGVALSRAEVLVLGVAYKKDLDDCRESPALAIIEYLLKAGASVSYHDPHVPNISHGGLSMQSVPLDTNDLGRYDLVLIATDHSCINYRDVVEGANVVFDTRHATKGVEQGHEKVVLL
jgi:nucleotide sugar dehydrogenase